MDYFSSEEYQDLITQIDANLVEAEFTARFSIVECWHKIGEQIRKCNSVAVGELVKRIASDIQRSERSVWLGIQIYDKYPSISSLPEGKNISLRKLQRVYLLGIDAEDCKHEKTREIRICTRCEKRIRE